MATIRLLRQHSKYHNSPQFHAKFKNICRYKSTLHYALYYARKSKFTFAFNSLNLVVTSCTNMSNIKISMFCPKSFFFVSLSVFKTNSDLHSNKKSIFITEMEYVYCAVRNKSINITQANFRLQTLKGRW